MGKTMTDEHFEKTLELWDSDIDIQDVNDLIWVLSMDMNLSDEFMRRVRVERESK